jgi:PAS domain S-box-containing protein
VTGKKTEQRTGSAELWLSTLVDAVTDYAIYMLDCDGVIASWNAGAARITGYTSAEALGQHYALLFTNEDRAHRAAQHALESARTNGRFESEGWTRRKDGSRFWALAVLQPIRDADGNVSGFASVMRDMTERHQAQMALADSERRFRLLVNGVTDYAIYMLDPNGFVTNWNVGAERIKGYTADEIIGQHFSRFYTPEERAAGAPGRVLSIAAREGRFEGEGWRVRKDRSRFWASTVVDAIRDEKGELVGFAKVTRDITERRMAQDALRASEQQFRMLVAGVTDYAIYMLDPNGVITSWNAGAQRIKGYAADQIIGQHFSRFFTDQDRSAGEPMRLLRTAMDAGRYEQEGWRVRRDGSLFFAHVVVDAIRDESGKLIGFAKITRDITERREAEARLQRAKDQLAQAQKLETLGQLTGGVAHDFNNLMMVVLGHAQMLRKRLTDPKDLRSIDAIHTAGTRGSSLTRKLLAFARRNKLNPTSIDLKARIEGLHDLLASSLRGDIAVTISIPREIWHVDVDAEELELALVNLTVNARDAMPSGGHVTITALNVPEGSGELPGGLSGDFVALSLADSGVGIAPDVLPKIFEPFFTTKEIDKGTGLGLSQVHGFAHQSGGTVTVESAVGQGTRMTLYLPRSRGAALQPKDQSSAAPETGKGQTVLLVEDNPEVANITVTMLRELGYAVIQAPGVEAALDILRAQADVALVLSDIVMPGPRDGLALAQIVREQYPRLPVLLATGYSRAAENAIGTFPLLRKPYQLADLGRAITNLLAARDNAAPNLVPFPSRKPKNES